MARGSTLPSLCTVTGCMQGMELCLLRKGEQRIEGLISASCPGLWEETTSWGLWPHLLKKAEWSGQMKGLTPQLFLGTHVKWALSWKSLVMSLNWQWPSDPSQRLGQTTCFRSRWRPCQPQWALQPLRAKGKLSRQWVATTMADPTRNREQVSSSTADVRNGCQKNAQCWIR